MARSGNQRSLRGRVAVVGIGETDYYRHGASPDAEFKLALKATLAACDDAGLDPRDIALMLEAARQRKRRGTGRTKAAA
jgi:hypothetical protein